MPYTLGQLKVFAYNGDFKPDFTIIEKNLVTGLAYCYEWFRYFPEDKNACEKLMGIYLEQYLYLSELKGVS